jgi:hypothetical protein
MINPWRKKETGEKNPGSNHYIHKSVKNATSLKREQKKNAAIIIMSEPSWTNFENEKLVLIQTNKGFAHNIPQPTEDVMNVKTKTKTKQNKTKVKNFKKI